MQTDYVACAKPTLAVIAIAAILVGGATAHASIIQDQRGGSIQILYGSPAGQTFTAVDPHIQSVGFWVEDLNPSYAPDDFAVDIRLYEGAGFSGTQIGMGTFGALSMDYNGWAEVPFPAVTLVPGQIYTAQIVDDDVRWGVAYFSDFWDFQSVSAFVNFSKGYAGGDAFFMGRPEPTTDFTFRVLASEATVPEPGSLGLVLIAVLGALAQGRARRSRARKD